MNTPKTAPLTLAMLATVSLAGCANVDAPLPAGVKDPSQYNSAAGAMGLFAGTVSAFGNAVVSYVTHTGVLTDEFQAADIGQPVRPQNQSAGSVDARILPEGTADAFDGDYNLLQTVRTSRSYAEGVFANYAPTTAPALRGEMLAFTGYAEVMLADVFCSGVPLSTLDFNRDYTYAPGSATADVYRHAVTLFDTAVTFAKDSEYIASFARLGRARALLNLGEYTAARQSADSVPDGFVYNVNRRLNQNTDDPTRGVGGSVADREGARGLPYRSANDPRVQNTTAGTNAYGVVMYFPLKYSPSGPGSVGNAPVVSWTVADWIEARLIRAESQLHDNDVAGWASTLNALRATAGAAAIPALTTDSTIDASPAMRVDVMFRERAFWLFLTGHRQGDLRRLVRPVSAGGYGRSVTQVYPSGRYQGVFGAYGSDITAPIPIAERANPKFTGCLSREA